MVDFRYHLVSIVAVFLALAVGIVLGTTFINGPLFDTLNNKVNSLTNDRKTLRSGNDDLNKRLADQAKFGKAVLPFAVGGRLANESVLLVSTADAPGDLRDSLARALVAAGAKVAGRVQLTKKFADPTQADVLEQVARDAVNGGSTGDAGSPLQHAANQLAIAVATPTRNSPEAVGPNAETQRILSGFEAAGLIKVDGDVPVRRSIVIVVSGVPAAKDSAGRDDQVRAGNEVIGALARQATAVVAVTPSGGAEAGGVLSSLRRDENLAPHVSSVDDADTPAGEVAVILAVVERLRAAELVDERRAAGHYGDGPGASKPLPDLADIS
ncbi:MAG: copper transporter [Actinomycetota bacterium]